MLTAAIALAQVQTAPITEPRGAEHEAAGPPIAKGAAAIRKVHTKCMTFLNVNADALFTPHRWTLNADAAETLDVLGPMIIRLGHHPVKIFAETSAADSDSENRDVSHRRALTVRTWLINHGFAPADTVIGEFNPDKPVAPPGKTIVSPSSERPRNNGVVKVIVNACH